MLTGSMQWKSIPLRNCGGDRFISTTDDYATHEVSGRFVAELLQMAYLLSSGDKIDADTRRDMGQRIQAALLR